VDRFKPLQMLESQRAEQLVFRSNRFNGLNQIIQLIVSKAITLPTLTPNFLLRAGLRAFASLNYIN